MTWRWPWSRPASNKPQEARLEPLPAATPTAPEALDEKRASNHFRVGFIVAMRYGADIIREVYIKSGDQEFRPEDDADLRSSLASCLEQKALEMEEDLEECD